MILAFMAARSANVVISRNRGTRHLAAVAALRCGVVAAVASAPAHRQKRFAAAAGNFRGA